MLDLHSLGVAGHFWRCGSTHLLKHFEGIPGSSFATVTSYEICHCLRSSGNRTCYNISNKFELDVLPAGRAVQISREDISRLELSTIPTPSTMRNELSLVIINTFILQTVIFQHMIAVKTEVVLGHGLSKIVRPHQTRSLEFTGSQLFTIATVPVVFISTNISYSSPVSRIAMEIRLGRCEIASLQDIRL